MKVSDVIAYLQKYQQEFGNVELELNIEGAKIGPDGKVPEASPVAKPVVKGQIFTDNFSWWKDLREELKVSDNLKEKIVLKDFTNPYKNENLDIGIRDIISKLSNTNKFTFTK